MNIVRISDGLGNQMFQYAYARKISILSRQRTYLDIRFINNEDLVKKGNHVQFRKKLGHRKYGLSHFNVSLQIADLKMLSHWEYLIQSNCMQQLIYSLSMQDKWIWRYRYEEVNYDGMLSKVELLFPTYYQGYFFALKYYDDIKHILQHDFSLKDKMKLLPELREALYNRNTVSLHIRRGDFLAINRDISGSEYYEKAVQVIESRVKSPIYLLFSDDIEWVKEHIRIPNDKIYVSGIGYEDYEELTIMKHCKHNIIANSTFSYWAAYLNSNKDKIVICPKHWRERIIPKDWICI